MEVKKNRFPYLSQEMARGRSVEEIVDEIGEPFIVAKTIIEHCEASGECAGDGGYESSYQESYSDGGNRSQTQSPFPNMRYIDLNQWYWKLLAGILMFLIVSLVFRH